MYNAMLAGAAFVAFAFLHSLTVSERFKSIVTGLAGERWMRAWYRLAFTAFSALASLLLALYYVSLPDTFLFRPPWYVLWPMHAVQLAGLWLMAAVMRPFSAGYFTGTAQARKYLSTGVTEGDIEGMMPGSLVTDGVYAAVRHPMYLAGILVFVFEPNVTLNCLAVRTLAVLYFLYGAIIEDSRLAARFGKAYRAYMDAVPRLNIAAGLMRIRLRDPNKKH